MHEIDFLPVENKEQDGGKSGDAIAARFTVDAERREAVIVVDGGFASIGEDMVEHILKYYRTSQVDLMISTHPDADHLNGLATIIEQLDVAELLIHQPRLHRSDLSDFSNLEALDNLLAVARRRGVSISEPFTGTSRFNGQLLILGPTKSYYRELLDEQLIEAKAVAASYGSRAVKHFLHRAESLLDKALTYLPIETLTDDGETSPRNNSSVVALLTVDSRRLLLTGDAGIPALEAAANYYEQTVGSFSGAPVSFFQAPHHGSKRNVGPTILNRMLGTPGAPYNSACVAFISSAKAAPEHPSPKVVNALSRRGCQVGATEGVSITSHHGTPAREGWVPLQPIGPLSEDDDED